MHNYLKERHRNKIHRLCGLQSEITCSTCCGTQRLIASADRFVESAAIRLGHNSSYQYFAKNSQNDNTWPLNQNILRTKIISEMWRWIIWQNVTKNRRRVKNARLDFIQEQTVADVGDYGKAIHVNVGQTKRTKKGEFWLFI